MVTGSDCPTGKRQFATKRDAIASASALRSKHSTTSAFRCAWCECWHVGNKGSYTSKGRSRHR